MSLDKTVTKAMVALPNLSKVESSLRFLADMNIIKSEAVFQGCKKYVKEHPEIQAWIDSQGFLDSLAKENGNGKKTQA